METFKGDNTNIIEFSNYVNNLDLTNDKITFVNNYNNIKETISEIDIVLSSNLTHDYDNKSIDELICLLELFNKNIEENNDLTVIEFRTLQLLTEHLENRLKNESMKITEVSNNF